LDEHIRTAVVLTVFGLHVHLTSIAAIAEIFTNFYPAIIWHLVPRLLRDRSSLYITRSSMASIKSELD